MTIAIQHLDQIPKPTVGVRVVLVVEAAEVLEHFRDNLTDVGVADLRGALMRHALALVDNHGFHTSEVAFLIKSGKSLGRLRRGNRA